MKRLHRQWMYEREFETHIMNMCTDISTIDDVWSKHDKSFAEWLRN
ncbi:hypothetical protein OROMI_023924 [Orobanche minor]